MEDRGFRSNADSDPQALNIECRYATIVIDKDIEIKDSALPAEALEQLRLAASQAGVPLTKAKRDKYLQYAQWEFEGLMSFIMNELRFTDEIMTRMNPEKDKFRYFAHGGKLPSKCGYACGGGKGLTVSSDDLTSPISGMVSHEFGHSIQAVYNVVMIVGESFCNWLMTTYCNGCGVYWAQNKRERMNVMLVHSCYYYEEVHFIEYVHSDPDGLGIPKDFWRRVHLRPEGVDFWTFLARYVDYKELLARFYARYVYFDIGKYAASYEDYKARRVYDEHAIFAVRDQKYLVRSPDADRWMPVPYEFPQQTGAGMYRVVPTGSSFTAAVVGVENTKWKSDWRLTAVVRRGDEPARYAGVVPPGRPLTVSGLGPGDVVHVVVVATPNDIGDFVSNNQEFFRDRPNVTKATSVHPYEINLVGATPEPMVNPLAPNVSGAVEFRVHGNGGGRVAMTARVDPTAFVDAGCMVLDTAQVLGNARIEGFATIRGDAVVRDYAVVSGNAVVGKGAVVRDRAKVRDQAVAQDATLSGFCRLLEKCWLYKFTMNLANARYAQAYSESATLKGYGLVSQPRIRGSTVIDGDWDRPAWEQSFDAIEPSLKQKYADIRFGHYTGCAVWLTNPESEKYFDYYAAEMPQADRQFYVIYDMDAARLQGAVLTPRWGFTNAIVRNSPRFTADADGKAYAVFGGPAARQAVVLQASVADIENLLVEVEFRVPEHADHTLFTLGAGAGSALSASLTRAGDLSVVMPDGSVAARAPVAAGVWHTLKVAWVVVGAGGEVTVEVLRGQTRVSGGGGGVRTAFTMSRALGNNYPWAGCKNFVGRGESGGFFKGHVAKFAVGFSVVGG